MGGKQSVKKRVGGLREKTQSKGEETEGVETEQKRKRGGGVGAGAGGGGGGGGSDETKCMQT